MFTIQYYGSRITIHSLMSEFAKNICHALHSTRQSPVHEFLKAMFDIGDCSNILNITTMVLIIEHHHRSNIILLYSISMRNAHRRNHGTGFSPETLSCSFVRARHTLITTRKKLGLLTPTRCPKTASVPY